MPFAPDADDPDDPAFVVDREQALVGAALLDPVAADLLLAEVNPHEVLCPLAGDVLWTLANLDPVRRATESALDLVIEELEGTHERRAIEALVTDRPELRDALAALRAAAARIMSIEDEPLVRLAAMELGAIADRESVSP